MTVVIGTAGHIDHGKTTLLHALTGMDADRLPDEKRRGLTLDIGYARGAPDEGAIIDYVDVPGHDRLVGNMLVGAGEIDGCLLVVAADDGPRAQTLEHLALIDALGIDAGIVALTKIDRVDSPRVEAVRVATERLLTRTTLTGSPIVPVAAQVGTGLEVLQDELGRLRDRLEQRARPSPAQRSFLAIDRAFSASGFGAVATGTWRGAPIETGARLTLMPGGRSVRIRGIQIHDGSVDVGPDGGRVALNATGIDTDDLRRGQVLTANPTDIVSSDRLLVSLHRPVDLAGSMTASGWPPHDGIEVRFHTGTDACEARLGRSGRDAIDLAHDRATAMLRLARAVAVHAGSRFVLRRPHPADLLAGGVVLDPRPPARASRRRQTPDRVRDLERAVMARDATAAGAAALRLHGVQDAGRSIATDVRDDLETVAIEAVVAAAATDPERGGIALAALRRTLVARLRRSVSIDPDGAVTAAGSIIDALLARESLQRDSDTIRPPGASAPSLDPAAAAAADELIVLLDVPAPPSLSAAVTSSGCPPPALRQLERDGGIVIVDADLAWSRAAYDALVATALELARTSPMTPATLRDATGTSRKYVMALLEDLARRGILTRTPAGHVPGPRA